MKKTGLLIIIIIGILYIRRKEMNEIIEYFSVDYDPTEQQGISWDLE
ncbi:hypothetical protein M4L90_03575 [Staphylococcus equorum]|uniref:Uncharacterized protein n=1 Tax=Staphylococcus equorum TaxID=246432 RepID=A0A9X4QWR5_9STAP|nr:MULTISPECIES: hypothetical protein [Staphylococcus]MDG0818972.1 hypothetical protein [Staphylococcus equorum]MDG0839613.1 hypothetical protein [Staphylococcus equorum]MDG0844661.1 hypothetical protein [Staphylococcus equorum]MEB7863902.1 hypothetical protein [Staphylococcus xylosus]